MRLTSCITIHNCVIITIVYCMIMVSRRNNNNIMIPVINDKVYCIYCGGSDIDLDSVLIYNAMTTTLLTFFIVSL